MNKKEFIKGCKGGLKLIGVVFVSLAIMTTLIEGVFLFIKACGFTGVIILVIFVVLLIAFVIGFMLEF